MNGPIVTIYIGPREVEFTLHKAALCKKSKWFSRALNGRFKEAAENVLRFPDDDPEVFALLASSIYCGHLPEYEKFSFHGSDGHGRDIWLLAKAWVMGDKYQLPWFQNQVMEDLCAYLHYQASSMDEHLMVWIYENTIVGSPLRQLVAEIVMELTVPRVHDSHSHVIEKLNGFDGFILDFHKAVCIYHHNDRHRFERDIRRHGEYAEPAGCMITFWTRTSTWMETKERQNRRRVTISCRWEDQSRSINRTQTLVNRWRQGYWTSSRHLTGSKLHIC